MFVSRRVAAWNICSCMRADGLVAASNVTQIKCFLHIPCLTVFSTSCTFALLCLSRHCVVRIVVDVGVVLVVGPASPITLRAGDWFLVGK